jgi:hypothetical protein
MVWDTVRLIEEEKFAKKTEEPKGHPATSCGVKVDESGHSRSWTDLANGGALLSPKSRAMN